MFLRDGHFYALGKDLVLNSGDDQPVRFFGMNVAFSGNFPAEADAPRIAKRLRKLGVNLVRLHHMDSSPDRDPSNAGSTLTTQPYPTLNSIAITRLRRFMDALKAEGIYVNVNLHVGYTFRPAVDGVPPLPGMEMPTQSKPLHIFFPRMVELQVQYARLLLDGLKLKADPVLAMIEIDNETSLVQAWMNGSLDRCLVGEYRAELQKQWAAYLKKDAPLVDAKDTANPLLNDYLLFLADRDRAYLDRMKAAARGVTDALVPVAGTQVGFGGLLNLESHAGLDYQDNHFYVDHYNFPNRSWDSRDWRIRDTSAVGSGLAAVLNMAATREVGRPYTVSEYNQPWPNRQAAELNPVLAAVGAFQDWDGIMHFAYVHGRNWDAQTPNSFNLNGDWTKYPNIGQSAWLFRSGAIQTGKTPVTVGVSRELALQFTREKRGGAVASFLQKNANFDPALALVHPVGIRRQEGAAAMKETPTSPYASDTGELVYDTAAKTFVIRAAKAAGVIGYAGGVTAGAGVLTVQAPKSAHGFATILVTALDDKPLRESTKMLISNPGYTLGTVPGTTPPRMQKLVNYPKTTDWFTIDPDSRGADRPSGPMDAGVAPVWMERVPATLTLQSNAKSLTVYPLDGAGKRLTPFQAERVQDGFQIKLQADGQQFAPWYEVVGN